MIFSYSQRWFKFTVYYATRTRSRQIPSILIGENFFVPFDSDNSGHWAWFITERNQLGFSAICIKWFKCSKVLRIWILSNRTPLYRKYGLIFFLIWKNRLFSSVIFRLLLKYTDKLKKSSWNEFNLKSKQWSL